MPNRPSRSGRNLAKGFLERFREVYRLVADVALGSEWLLGGDVLIVGHGVTQSSTRGQPVRLSNGMYLNVEMTLRINRVSAPPPVRIETTRATYTYQASGDLDDPKPVFVYDYNRDVPYPYPRCHLHVHAVPKHYTGDQLFPRLHLPTRRITLEQVVWHLIREHAVEPRHRDWHEVLWRHEEWFRDIQKNRASWPYDRPFDRPEDSQGPVA